MDIRNYNFSDLSELTSIGLSRGGIARLEQAQGTQLRVETGAIWVTQQGGDDDFVVEAGESFMIERDGTTVLSALGRRLALVTIQPPVKPARPTFGERLERLWCSLYAENEPARDYL